MAWMCATPRRWNSATFAYDSRSAVPLGEPAEHAIGGVVVRRHSSPA
jgi:hypothetical protein